MNLNEHYFTGQVEYVKERRIQGQTWGNLNTRILLDTNSFKFNNEDKIIPNSTIWLNIKVEYDSKSLKKQHQKIFDMCSNKSYIFVHGAKIVDFKVVPKDENNNIIPNAPQTTRYSAEVTPGNVSCSLQRYTTFNRSYVTGYVEEVLDNGSLKIKSSYLVKKEIRSREIFVINNSNSLSGPSLLAKKVFVSGSIFGKTPDRLDLIYVAADFIEII